MSRNFLIGITGSIGSIIIPSYIVAFRQRFSANISVLMTRNSTKFVTPFTMGVVTSGNVYCDDNESKLLKTPHITLTESADIFLIMPASANVLSKSAYGICDDILSTSILASKIPPIYFPSMNENMWNSNVVQENIERIEKNGGIVIPPAIGIEVSDLSPSLGAMPSFRRIVTIIETYINH